MISPVSLHEFQELVLPLIGLPLSRTHEGYFKTALIHLGELAERKFPDGKTIYEGEASFMLEWHWRVERDKDIWFSSHSKKTERKNGLRKLESRTIIGINVEGRLPELVIELSNGLWVKSFSLVEGQPQWSIFLRNGGCIFSQSGELVLNSNCSSTE